MDKILKIRVAIHPTLIWLDIVIKKLNFFEDSGPRIILLTNPLARFLRDHFLDAPLFYMEKMKSGNFWLDI